MTREQRARGWKVCHTCPPDDNEWPPSEFYAGMARCKACYIEQRYPNGRTGRAQAYVRKLRASQTGAAA